MDISNELKFLLQMIQDNKKARDFSLKNNLIVREEDSGIRLDIFISINLNINRSIVKKIIKNGKVYVNNEPCFKSNYKVKKNDCIRLDFSDIKIFNGAVQSLQESLHVCDLINSDQYSLDIIYEDDDYLFINKPSGMVVHPVLSNDSLNLRTEITLIDLIKKYQGKFASFSLVRSGIVHRLDRETSGVLMFAKNARSLWWISKLFAERKVLKKYISIGVNFLNSKVSNVFEISGYIYKSKKDFRFHFESLKRQENSRYSLSKFTKIDSVILEGVELILFCIEPKTGRTHQIRVHQKFKNVPILFDKIYANKKCLIFFDRLSNLLPLSLRPRLCLHAYSLEFVNYNGRLINVSSEIDKIFNFFFENVEAKIKNVASKTTI